MKEKNIYSEEPNALDIVDEALSLQHAAANEVCELSFEETLEIMKIQRLDKLCKGLKTVAGRIDVLSNVIHEER